MLRPLTSSLKLLGLTRVQTAFLSGLDNGDCPSTHPVGLMKLFYEVIFIRIYDILFVHSPVISQVTWSVTDFGHLWTPGKDQWPFVWSTGYVRLRVR